jgi:hypothetical protein
MKIMPASAESGWDQVPRQEPNRIPAVPCRGARNVFPPTRPWLQRLSILDSSNFRIVAILLRRQITCEFDRTLQLPTTIPSDRY